MVRNAEVRMVEYRPEPGGGYVRSVAAYACCRVGRGHVIRNCGAIILRAREVGLMAAVTIRRRVTAGVVAAQMAIGARIDHRPDRARYSRARWQHMGALERESCRAVIKFSICPQQRVVTSRAERSGKACCNVIRHSTTKCRRAVPSRLVAAVAIRVRRSEGVVVAHVAIRAGHNFARGRQLV